MLQLPRSAQVYGVVRTTGVIFLDNLLLSHAKCQESLAANVLDLNPEIREYSCRPTLTQIQYIARVQGLSDRGRPSFPRGSFTVIARYQRVLTAAYQHLQSYPLLLCDNSWELFFGSYNLTLEWAIDLFASPRMTSRLVLVIGDLFIPDRAPVCDQTKVARNITHNVLIFCY
jgi:hypothetical protein